MKESLYYVTINVPLGLSPRHCLQIEMQASPSEEELRDSAQEKVKAGLKEVGSLRIVQNRGLEIGDVAVIDIELRRKEDGELIEGSQQTSKQIDTATAQYTVELPGGLATCNCLPCLLPWGQIYSFQ